MNEKQYTNSLLTDFREDVRTFKKAIGDRALLSIFIGGGTPSLFSADSFAYLLQQLREEIKFSDDIEITLEANPGSSEADKFTGFRQSGINRLSIGVQSFSSEHLNTLGRIHDSKEALQAASFARQAGFDNFNLDLMFGLPQQSIDQCLSDVALAISQQASHLSCYQLTIEPNTPFHHQPPLTPDDDALWEMQTALQHELTKSEYQQYEVSAYSQQNKQCQHNLNYWRFGDYLGIGAGAHGKITNTNHHVQRYWKAKHPSQYQQFAQNEIALLTGELKTVTELELPFEFMINVLRLKQGFNINLYEQRTGLDSSSINTTIEKHVELGLATRQNDHVKATDKGYLFLNSMLDDYLV